MDGLEQKCENRLEFKNVSDERTDLPTDTARCSRVSATKKKERPLDSQIGMLSLILICITPEDVFRETKTEDK